MFTGLIETVGTVEASNRSGGGARLSISARCIFTFLANWLESEEGGHHLPYMPLDISQGFLESSPSWTIIFPSASVRTI